MLNIFKGIFFTLALFAIGLSFAQAQQNISVTVDNSSFEIPDTPIIIRSENVNTASLDLVVEVGAVHANTDLDFVVVATRVDTGDTVTLTYDQAVNSSSRTTLDVTGLLPGTEYDIVVRYSRDGMNIFSANSDPHNVSTAINPPILDSIDDVDTDSMTLDVVVDPAFIGDTMDFIIEVEDENGDSYTVQMTRTVNSSSVSLDIDDLDPGTEYSFRVRYARENSGHYSDYSNEESETTDIEAPSITDTQNADDDSVEIVVDVGDEFSGDDVDLVVRVRNTETGEVREIDFTEEVGSNGQVVLEIDDLDEDTEYEISVKFAPEGSSNFSDYSNTVTVTTTGNDDDDGKVTLCHNGKTISVSKNAVKEHLRHGDYLGECTEEGGDGGPRVDPTPPGTVSGGDAPVVDDGGDRDFDKEELREAIIPEETKDAYQTAAIVGATAGSVMALAGSAVPFFTAMPGAFSSSVFLKFIELFGIIGRRKRERNWGVVFDNITHIPIPAAKIILLDESGKEMATTYSDRDGRFGFLANPGKYMMNIYKKDYDLITDEETDDLYGNVYDGGIVEMGDDHIILTNIAMKSEKVDWEEYANKKVKQYKSKFSTFKRYLFLALYVLGFGSTAILTFFYPNLFNICVLSIYIVMFIYQTFFKKRRFGMIETGKGNPVPFAVVSLHDDDSGEKRRFAVTDAIGRYYLLADNGDYKMKAKGQPVSGTSFEKQGDVKVDDGIVRKDLIV